MHVHYRLSVFPKYGPDCQLEFLSVDDAARHLIDFFKEESVDMTPILRREDEAMGVVTDIWAWSFKKKNFVKIF